MNRLKTAKSTATSGSDCWGLDYTYDRYANLLGAAISSDRGGSGCSAPTLSLSINTSNNRITNTGFTYDAAGNLTSDGSASYTWNAEGRMASTAGVTYTYDGDGQRTKKEASSPSAYDRLYWYGPGGQVLAESELDGDIISEFIYFGRTRIARRDVATGNVYYFLFDRLGTARVLTNASGTVVEESDFYPFGAERVITDTLDNQYKFTQHERDAESGLDHTLERQYGCNIGRWYSPDRMRGTPTDPQSFNRYAYAGNTPTDYYDPDGAHHCEFWIGYSPGAEFPSMQMRCGPGGVQFPSFEEQDWGAYTEEEVEAQVSAIESRAECLKLAGGSLSDAQMAILGTQDWESLGTYRQAAFFNITAALQDAGLDFSDLTIADIAQDRITFTAGEEEMAGFSSAVRAAVEGGDFFYDTPNASLHQGYSLWGARQGVTRGQLQISFGERGVEIDIDEHGWRTNWVSSIRHGFEILRNRILNTPTDPFTVGNILRNRGVNLGHNCQL